MYDVCLFEGNFNQRLIKGILSHPSFDLSIDPLSGMKIVNDRGEGRGGISLSKAFQTSRWFASKENGERTRMANYFSVLLKIIDDDQCCFWTAEERLVDSTFRFLSIKCLQLYQSAIKLYECAWTREHTNECFYIGVIPRKRFQKFHLEANCTIKLRIFFFQFLKITPEEWKQKKISSLKRWIQKFIESQVNSNRRSSKPSKIFL